MARKRLNSKQRKRLANARNAAMINARIRVSNDESIPLVRSNVSSWDRVPKFGGIGWTSGHDPAASGMKANRREIELDTGMKHLLG